MPLIRVLIVDDSSVIRRTLKTVLLSDPDFNLVGAGCDGKEGVELALKLKPDLVILDVDMPIMNGLEVLAELKRKIPNYLSSCLVPWCKKEALLPSMQFPGCG